jgi:hypothetical protein
MSAYLYFLIIFSTEDKDSGSIGSVGFLAIQIRIRKSVKDPDIRYRPDTGRIFNSTSSVLKVFFSRI